MNKNKIAKILATTAIASGLIVVATDSVEAKAQVTKDVKNDVSEKVEDIKKGQVVNVNSNVRIRENANEDSKVIGYLTNGQEVEIIGETKGWYQIKSNDVKGYIKFDYIKVLSDTNIVTGTVVNISTTLSVRETSDVLGKELAKLTNGTKLIVIGEEDSWYKIKYENLVGYVYKDYVKVNKENTQIENNFESVQERAISKTKGTVTGVNTSLNVRSGASTSASIIGTLKNGAKVEITGESGNWYKINYNGKVGYVYKSYIKKGTTGTTGTTGGDGGTSTTTEKKGVVVGISTTLNVRSGASTSASIIGTLRNGAQVTIIGESGNWYKIKFNERVGYVSKDYVREGNSNDGQGQVIRATFENVYAVMSAHIGSPYVWGGAGEYLTSSLLYTLSKRFPADAANGAYSRAWQYVDQGYRAFDCSGLMQWGYAQVGIKIGRTTWDQITCGTEVSLNNLKPGDLLFNTSLTHVGMYIGNGQWIESPNRSANVRVTAVPWGSIGRARRVLK
ncbi:MAG: SH3 domain-containing protein [Clostridium sp.]|nr:SH3 domain-containing protein [Clostridium sp.]